MGQLFVFRARKQYSCKECAQPVVARAWYCGLVGRARETGKRYTSRFHLNCFILRLGRATSSQASARDHASGGLTPAEKADRRRLVSLRNYHFRAGHTSRVDEIDRLIGTTGVPAQQSPPEAKAHSTKYSAAVPGWFQRENPEGCDDDFWAWRKVEEATLQAEREARAASAKPKTKKQLASEAREEARKEVEHSAWIAQMQQEAESQRRLTAGAPDEDDKG